jgi:hypothetical protein
MEYLLERKTRFFTTKARRHEDTKEHEEKFKNCLDLPVFKHAKKCRTACLWRF